MPVVSITRLRIRRWRYLLPFLVYTTRAIRQAKTAEGNLGVWLLRDAQNTFWTRTVWTTEAAMKGFMLAGPHRKAMPRLLEWCDEASVARWEAEAGEPLDWRDVHRRMQAEGRRSKVRHPSVAHEKFEIPAPKL